jgi:hypothetical protein
MNTTHKPASPFPWIVKGGPNDLAGGRFKMPAFIQGQKVPGVGYAVEVLGADYTGFGDEEAREKDLRFVHHAATKYEQMVEALRSIGMCKIPGVPDGCTVNMEQFGPFAMQRAREVLESIGEELK